MNVHIFKTPLGEEFAILPKAEYDHLIEALEDLEDIEAAGRFYEKLAAGEEELIPSQFVDRILDGENKINVWREYRNMSAKALADAADISESELSQIESGAREGSLNELKKIAQALKLTIDELI